MFGKLQDEQCAIAVVVYWLFGVAILWSSIDWKTLIPLVVLLIVGLILERGLR